jgi:hypothetical protein
VILLNFDLVILMINLSGPSIIPPQFGFRYEEKQTKAGQQQKPVNHCNSKCQSGSVDPIICPIDCASVSKSDAPVEN